MKIYFYLKIKKKEEMTNEDSLKKENLKTVRSSLDHWIDTNNQLRLYKWIGAICAGIGMLLLCVVLFQSLKSPLVIYDDGSNKIPLKSESKPFKIDEEQISRFLTEYLFLYFKWEKLDPDKIIKEIGPFTSDALSEKINIQLLQRRDRDFKNQSVSQDIAHVKINVNEKEITATYDKVLRISGIPLVVPCEASFQIVDGPVTNWNLLGLYVNGIIEHEGTKGD